MFLSRMRFQAADDCQLHCNDKRHKIKKNKRIKKIQTSYTKKVFAVKQSSAHEVWGAVHKYMMWRRCLRMWTAQAALTNELLMHCNNIYISQPLQLTHAQQTEILFMKVGCIVNNILFLCTHIDKASELTSWQLARKQPRFFFFKNLANVFWYLPIIILVLIPKRVIGCNGTLWLQFNLIWSIILTSWIWFDLILSIFRTKFDD